MSCATDFLFGNFVGAGARVLNGTSIGNPLGANLQHTSCFVDIQSKLFSQRKVEILKNGSIRLNGRQFIVDNL